MSLQARLEEDLKNAMRSKDTLRLSVIRYLRSAIGYEEIDKQAKLDDEGIIRVIQRQVQQRRDSIAAFEKGNRQDLIDKEKAELAILMEYLPQQLSRDEITAIVRQAIQEMDARGPQDTGKVMGKVMPQVRGRAEGREVSAVVQELLRNLQG